MTRSQKKAKKATVRAARQRRNARVKTLNAETLIINKREAKKAPNNSSRKMWAAEGDRFVQAISENQDVDLTNAFHTYRGTWYNEDTGAERHIGIHETDAGKFVVGQIDCEDGIVEPALYFGFNGCETWDTIGPAMRKTRKVAKHSHNASSYSELRSNFAKSGQRTLTLVARVDA